MGDNDEPTNLKQYVEQCADVAELHDIAKEKFGEAIHNRTGLEKSRERVLELIDEEAGAGQAAVPADNSQPDDGSANAADKVPAKGKPKNMPQKKAETPKFRQLENKRTGRRFTWTKALSKNKNMFEVQ